MLILLLALFPIFSNGMKTINIKYWTNSSNFIEVTNECTIWVLEGKEKVQLELEKKGFIFNGENLRSVQFLILDQNGKEHIVSPCITKSGQKELVLEIGNSMLNHFPAYQQRPFFPILDKVYLEIDKSKAKKRYPNLEEGEAISKVKEDLRDIGLKKIAPAAFSVFRIDTNKSRNDVVNSLIKLDVVKTGSVLYKFEKNRGWNVSTLLKSVDVLVDNSMDDKDGLKLLKRTGVLDVEMVSSEGVIWEEFDKGKAFRIIFSTKSMLSFDFLRELQNLLQNQKIMALKTSIGSPVILD